VAIPNPWPYPSGAPRRACARSRHCIASCASHYCAISSAWAERRFAASLDTEAEPIAHDATPERVAIEKERFRHLGEAIRGLPDCERECLLLRAEGQRYREIGEVLNIPTSTVADTVDRAIRKLAEKCHV
jgi:RNA polymerase sigma factor (sigma-70 family)